MYSIWCAKDMEAAFLAIHYNIIIGFECLRFSLRLALGVQQFRLRTQLPIKALCTDPYLAELSIWVIRFHKFKKYEGYNLPLRTLLS